MIFQTWVSFVLASTIVVFIPGPNIILTINCAIRDGKRSGLGDGHALCVCTVAR